MEQCKRKIWQSMLKEVSQHHASSKLSYSLLVIAHAKCLSNCSTRFVLHFGLWLNQLKTLFFGGFNMSLENRRRSVGTWEDIRILVNMIPKKICNIHTQHKQCKGLVAPSLVQSVLQDTQCVVKLGCTFLVLASTALAAHGIAFKGGI